MRKLLIPEAVQTSAMDCGPASLKSLLEGFGISASYGRLHEACQTDVDGTNYDSSFEILSAPAAVPVVDAGAARVVLVSSNDNLIVGNDLNYDASILNLNYLSNWLDANNNGTFDDVTEGFDASLGTNIYVPSTVDEPEGWGVSAINEVGLSSAHIALINNGGDLAYYRRNSAGSVTGPIVLDASGFIGAGVGDDLPLYEPSISLVQKNVGPEKQVYIAYLNSARTQINYFTCASTATVIGDCQGPLAYRAGTSMANPKLGFWAAMNEPLPILWNDAANVYFDKIITSTFAIPSGVAVSTAVAFNAFLTQPNYDVLITGNNFEYIPNVSSPTPSFQILSPGETVLEGVVRETLEETAWEVQPTGLVGIYHWRSPMDGAEVLRFTIAARALRQVSGRAYKLLVGSNRNKKQSS